MPAGHGRQAQAALRVGLFILFLTTNALGADPARLAVWECPSPPPAPAACRQIVLEAPAASVYSVDLRLSYTPGESSLVSVGLGSLAGGMALAVNTTTPGLLKVGLAGATPVGGAGPILQLEFSQPSDVLVRLEAGSVNEGSLECVLLPTATLLSPAAGDEVSFPATFTWATTGPLTNPRVGFAATDQPGAVALSGVLSGDTDTLSWAEWSNLKTQLGTATTYYWTVGEAGSFHPAAAWRPFVPVSPPPTAARLIAFHAFVVEPGRAVLRWRTGVEFDLMGFRVERRQDDDAWNGRDFPLYPAHGGSQPCEYSAEDNHVCPSRSTVYRLLAVNLRGEASVLAEAALRLAPRIGVFLSTTGLLLRCEGVPNTALTIETSTEPHAGRWTPVQSLRLGDEGIETAVLKRPPHETARYYRLRAE